MALFDPADIDSANEILYSEKITSKQKQRLTFFLQKSKKLLDHYEYEEQRQAVADIRKKPNYNMFYREGMLIRFYTGVDDSKTVIENAHKLRNANPLSHASSQLLDSNDTSKDLCKSIKALSKLIYGYIDKHQGTGLIWTWRIDII